ncbi:MAG: sigma-54 dependent transcriptional regulator [Phycisphaerae bacterium]|nr:sigma-54 dependent transcriptional regulator [Phycisphaerae bacterium]
MSTSPVEMIGASPAWRQALDLARRVCATNATVLITGETGTGKEVIARHIHRNSARRDRPLIICACGSGPAELVESDLFGHERGAFTGAIQPRVGVFERAHRATLLLDEVADIPRATQAKLLRVLQERRFTRLGAPYALDCDVRVIATTHADLRKLVARGLFREDLFYRLNVFPIPVPPLRERRQDIGLLAEHFLAQTARQQRSRRATLSELALAALVSYDWPGNVRQLQSVLERAALLVQGRTIDAPDLPAELLAGWTAPAPGESPTSLAYAQRLRVARVMHECNWRLTPAATRLGVSPQALRQLVRQLGLKPG